MALAPSTSISTSDTVQGGDAKGGSASTNVNKAVNFSAPAKPALTESTYGKFLVAGVLVAGFILAAVWIKRSAK